MNLFKRFCAVITIIAIIASFGVTTFATGATVSFGGEPLVAKTSTAGVYEVTVPYTVTGELGDMGLTMFTYTGNVAKDNPSTDDVNEFTKYDPDDKTMTIVGINQWGKNELPDADNVAENGNQIKFNAKMAEGATGLVMLGGDGVGAAAIEVFTAPWDAKFATYTGGALAVNVAYPYGDEEKEAAILDAIVATNIQVSGENGNTAMVTGLGAELTAEDITIAIESDEDTSATHTVSFVLPEETTLDNGSAVLGANVTVTIPVCVTNIPWTPTTLTLGVGDEMSFSIAALGEDAFGSTANTEDPEFEAVDVDALLEDYVKAEILKGNITLSTAEGEGQISEALAGTADAIAESITLTADTAYVKDTFKEAAQPIDYTVTFNKAEGITNVIGNVELETTITVTVTKYEASWDVITATFQYPSGDALAVEYDVPDTSAKPSDKETKAKAALVDKIIVLAGAGGQTHNYLIKATDEIVINGTTATVTVPEGNHGIAVVATGGMDVEVTLKYEINNGAFTASDATLVKGEDTVATLDITIKENTAAEIKAAVLAEGLSVKATLTRGAYVVKDVLIPVTEDMITANVADITDLDTTGAYTATIKVEATVDITIEDGIVGKLAADLPVNISGNATVQSYNYGDVNNDGNITVDDILQLITFVNNKNIQIEYQFPDSKKPGSYVPTKFADVTGEHKNPGGEVTVTVDDILQLITFVNNKNIQIEYTFPVLTK